MNHLAALIRIVVAMTVLTTAHAMARDLPAGLMQDLPPDVVRDLMLEELEGQLKEKRFRESIDTIQRLRGAGAELPPSIDFFEGVAYCAIEERELCIASVKKYLQPVGSDGRFYKDALPLFNNTIREVEEQKRQAQKRANAPYVTLMYRYVSYATDFYWALKSGPDAATSEERAVTQCWGYNRPNTQMSKCVGLTKAPDERLMFVACEWGDSNYALWVDKASEENQGEEKLYKRIMDTIVADLDDASLRKDSCRIVAQSAPFQR